MSIKQGLTAAAMLQIEMSKNQNTIGALYLRNINTLIFPNNLKYFYLEYTASNVKDSLILKLFNSIIIINKRMKKVKGLLGSP